ncbi:hypothetical protein HUU53_02415 [Candidatus Micrarchaeota archaeon]|nr:hypothetical protein [Candidatus Micrarchaeota archaeon]
MKAQVSAPIELLIAVFVMGLSLALAFSVLNQTSQEQCYAELKTESLKLQAAMQNVALGNTPTSRTVYYKKPSSCGALPLEGIRIVYYSNPAYCGACPNNYGSCWQINPVSYDFKTDSFYSIQQAVVCVDISGRFEISDDTACLLDENGNPSGTPISLNPGTCPDGSKTCSDDNSGVPKSVYDSSSPENSPSRFYTIGRTSKGYEITLTKGISVVNGVEAGQINVCVKER